MAQVFFRLLISFEHFCTLKTEKVSHFPNSLTLYLLGCRQKMKIFPGALFGMDSTQGSIWRPFFCRPTSFYLTTRAFYAAPLAASSWNPPVRTVLASTSEIRLRIGIFGWFSHILYKILPRSQRTFPIQNPLPLQKVTLVQLNLIFIPLRGVS